jgi:hypothetical protein
MPATFAHCLIARESISRMGSEGALYSGVLKMKNNFVVMGATGPDYPYLTDVIKYGVLHIGHNWANRMHYENVSRFIGEGVKKLLMMDKKSEQFQTCLAWFAGYMSHVIVDSYVHPVINRIVNGTYIFTHVEHGHCELIQDIYIFKRITDTDIIDAAPRDRKTFGYLDILDDCSDPNDLDKIHPHIRVFWSDLLKAAHPQAFPYFKDIDPDEWHKNYKARINFISDSRSIFRHVLNIADAPRYVAESEIDPLDRVKYIENVLLPGGQPSISYDALFDRTVNLVVSKWKTLFQLIEDGKGSLPLPVKDWDLDTGVDEDRIDLWMEA